MMNATTLKEKIDSKSSTIGIIGLGYVGLPLAIACAKAGFPVIGIEKSPEKLQILAQGKSYIKDVEDQDVTAYITSGSLKPSDDASLLNNADIVLICVPTPIDEHKVPDLSLIKDAAQTIAAHIKQGQLIILESTTYPGCTEEFLRPILEQRGLNAEKDFFLAFSPERVDPNNTAYPITKIPKVVGGLTQEATDLACAFYATFTPTPFKVSSPKAAEMTKLLENMFRLVNISMVNELSLLCGKMGIDIWEVIEAAKTKPYGFMPFYPGPGIGGHCFLENQQLMVRDEYGDRMTSIEELYVACNFPFSRYSKVPVTQTTGSHQKIIELQTQEKIEKGLEITLGIPKQPISIASFNPRDGSIIYNPITLVSKRKTTSLITIHCHYNYDVSVTENHPIFVWDEHASSPMIKFAKDVSMEDFLVMPRLLPSTDKKICYNLVEIIKTRFPFLAQKLRIKLSGDEFKNYKTIVDRYYKGDDRKHDYLKNNSLPFENFLHMQNEFSLPPEKILIASGRGPSFATVSTTIELDADLARLIGYYLSEGCITKEKKTMRIRWTFHPDEKEYIEDVQSILKEKNIRYSVHTDKKSKSYHIKVSSHILALFFSNVLKTGVNCYTMRIPSILFESNENLRREVLKGLLRGDGGVSYRNKKHTYRKNGGTYTHNDSSVTISYFTSSPLLFEQVQLIFHELGVVPKHNSRQGFITFHGKENAEKLMMLFDGKKRKLIHAYLSSIKKSVSYRYTKQYGHYLLIKVKDVVEKEVHAPVYSLEVAHTNTLLINGGIAVHNCIAIDPFYLTWKAKEFGFYPRFIELAGEINDLMTHTTVTKIIWALNQAGKPLNGSRVFILGVTYKKDITDMRESPAYPIIADLIRKKAQIAYHDPGVSNLMIEGVSFESTPLSKEEIAQADLVLILTDHSSVDYEMIAEHAKLVVDTRHVIKEKKPTIIT